MDVKIFDEIKLLYPFVNTEKLKCLDYSRTNLYKDNNFSNFDPNDFGLSIINLSDKKKNQTERVNTPSNYDEYFVLRSILDKNGVNDKYEQDRIIIAIEIQKNNFVLDDIKSEINLNVDCFPEYCVICNNKVDVIKKMKGNNIDLIIQCTYNNDHKFSYEEYCSRIK